MTYAAPLADMRFTLATIAGLEGEAAEIADAILDEAARFAAAELAPLNQPADRVGSILENGVVRTPPGFRKAYRRYVEGGWMGLAVDPAHRACNALRDRNPAPSYADQCEIRCPAALLGDFMGQPVQRAIDLRG